MKQDAPQPRKESAKKPVVVHKRPFSMESLLSHTWPCSDEETEEFVAMIYAWRKEPETKKPPFT